MNFRTDLVIEQREAKPGELPEGVTSEEATAGPAKITRIKVLNQKGEEALGKKIGSYITIELPPFTDSADEIDDRYMAISNEIKALLPKEGLVLVAGLGNMSITPDALGPKTTHKVLATRHIMGEIARSAGLEDLRSVCVLSPGVLGQTGIETSEILAGIVEKVKPAAVIVVDALASRRLARLGCTVQISDTGIHPGSGVGNKRAEISRETLGVPVIAIGVPTVVDAATLAADLATDAGGDEKKAEELRKTVEPRGATMMVTPREVDLLVDRASALIALSINKALHPTMTPEDLLALAS